MDRFTHLRFSAAWRKYAIPYLACSWILGLIFGLWAVRYADFHFPVTEDSVYHYTPISIVTVAFLPVLMSVLAAYADKTWLLPAIGFWKAFSFAYVSYLMTSAYGSAGWLIQLLVMFSDCVSLPFLWWFLCLLLRSSQKISFSSVFPIILGAIALGVLDFKMVSPFWSTLQILQKG